MRNCLEEIKIVIKATEEDDERVNCKEDERTNCRGKGRVDRRKQYAKISFS